MDLRRVLEGIWMVIELAHVGYLPEYLTEMEMSE